MFSIRNIDSCQPYNNLQLLIFRANLIVENIVLMSIYGDIMLSKKITLSLLLASVMATSVQAQPKIDPFARVAIGAIGLMTGVLTYQTGKNTTEIVQDFIKDPRASNTYWNLRVGTPPIVPMITNGVICLATAAFTTACAIEAIAGKDVLCLYQR